MVYPRCTVALVIIYCISCVTLAGLSITMIRKIHWINKPSLIIITISSLLLFVLRMVESLFTITDQKFILTLLAPTILTGIIFGASIGYFDQLIKHFIPNKHANIIIAHLSILWAQIITSISWYFSKSYTFQAKEHQDLEQSMSHVPQNVILKSSDQTLRPELDWLAYIHSENPLKTTTSKDVSTSNSSTITKINSFFKKTKTMRESHSKNTETFNSKNRYVTSLSDIPDVSYYNENLDVTEQDLHNITLSELRLDKEITTQNAEQHALHRTNSILLPPCLNRESFINESQKPEDDDISSIPRKTSFTQPNFKMHDHVKSENSSANTFPIKKNMFSFPNNIQSPEQEHMHASFNDSPIDLQKTPMASDTVENLDNFLNSRKKSLYPGIEEFEMFEEGFSYTPMLNVPSSKTLPSLITSELATYNSTAHSHNKHSHYHTPTKSANSVGPGVKGSSFSQNSPSTSHRSISRKNSFSHKFCKSVGSFTTVKRNSLDNNNNKTTMSSPTRSTKGARLVHKLSLSNVSFQSETNTYTAHQNNHKGGKSQSDFSYLNSLQQVNTNSPKRSAHLPKDPMSSFSKTTIDHSMDQEQFLYEGKTFNSYKRIESGESGDSGKTMESTNYPPVLVSEYDKEKWRIISEINV